MQYPVVVLQENYMEGSFVLLVWITGSRHLANIISACCSEAVKGGNPRGNPQFRLGEHRFMRTRILVLFASNAETTHPNSSPNNNHDTVIPPLASVLLGRPERRCLCRSPAVRATQAACIWPVPVPTPAVCTTAACICPIPVPIAPSFFVRNFDTPPNSPSTTCKDLDGGRTLYSIVQSCIVTVFACVWVAVHRNIPGPRQSWISIHLEWPMVIALTLFVPETTPQAARQCSNIGTSQSAPTHCLRVRSAGVGIAACRCWGIVGHYPEYV